MKTNPRLTWSPRKRRDDAPASDPGQNMIDAALSVRPADQYQNRLAL
ncbi:MAG: hypothetical protein V5B40_19650 [Candidatus Accumulibacter meliphilus]|jgi:hypothetical protein